MRTDKKVWRNRKARKELARRLQSENPGLEVVHPHAAGIDVGNGAHYAAVRPDRDSQPVRRFECFTADLYRLADWLQSCGVQTVALQSTGVYWIPLYNILEERGLEVYLVNARHTKNLPGRKSDVQESQWLLKLHTYGLLNNSFQPPSEIRTLRTYWRQRLQHVTGAATCVQRMQKALTQMNIQLAHVISDLSGVTGQLIVRAIVAGERAPQKLAELSHPRIQASRAEIAKSLEEISACFLMQGTQEIQLLVVVFGASPHPGFADLRKPFRTVPWCIHFFAGTRNAPTAIPGLQPIHDPGEVFADRQITARQLLQRSQAVLSVIHRLDVVHIQLFGQLAGIDPITLTAVSRGILSRIAHQHFRDVGLQQVIQPGRPSPFLKCDAQIPAQPVDELQNRARFGLDDTLHHDLANRVPHGDRNAFLVYVQLVQATSTHMSGELNY